MENTGTFLTTLDFVVFFGSLLGVMALGLWAGRNESTSKDYFLAGRNVRWWGVAGSIFGSNISANHMVGMMGVGFTLGFAESHFEITAIAGLLVLCYCFLPVYRKLNIYTLSDYLSRRYDDKSRVAYSVIMVLIITMVMMLPAFYIGSRSVNFLLVDQAHINEVLKASAGGEAQTIEIDKTYYILGVLIMALVTGVYTIVGGLKAVIVTDVLQSVLMLAGALIVAWFTFNSVEIGGWDGMRALDAKGKDLVHLYLPSDHPQRPWTGMLSGLMVLHFYYWGANQFIVQRALAAKTDQEARGGIITAGFVKLLIPFISIGTGIAVFAFLPWCQLNRGNVVVDFFMTRAPTRAKTFFDTLGAAMYLVIASLLTWRMIFGGIEMYETAERSLTLNFLRWQTFPISVLMMAFLVVVVAYTVGRNAAETRAGRYFNDQSLY